VVIEPERQLTSHSVLITGPSPLSIGAETALSLARGVPSTLILTARTSSKLSPLITEIHSLSPSTIVHVITMDLSSQSSVKRGVEEVKGLVEKIDVLIHCAGIMVTPFEMMGDWGVGAGAGTGSGVESQFATNFLGGWGLVRGEMGLVLKGGNGGGWCLLVVVHMGWGV
jgi:NAD(P)-dependent dehydrogenase (short-subunit alcohol dehydrogenase family)